MAGRNALKDAMPAPTAPGPAPEAGPSPEAEMERLMRETGYKGSDPAEGMAHVWKAMPTDEVAELIDTLSQKHGLPTPFPKETEKGATSEPAPAPPPAPPPVSTEGNNALMRHAR